MAALDALSSSLGASIPLAGIAMLLVLEVERGVLARLARRAPSKVG